VQIGPMARSHVSRSPAHQHGMNSIGRLSKPVVEQWNMRPTKVGTRIAVINLGGFAYRRRLDTWTCIALVPPQRPTMLYIVGDVFFARHSAPLCLRGGRSEFVLALIACANWPTLFACPPSPCPGGANSPFVSALTRASPGAIEFASCSPESLDACIAGLRQSVLLPPMGHAPPILCGACPKHWCPTRHPGRNWPRRRMWLFLQSVWRFAFLPASCFVGPWLAGHQKQLAGGPGHATTLKEGGQKTQQRRARARLRPKSHAKSGFCDRGKWPHGLWCCAQSLRGLMECPPSLRSPATRFLGCWRGVGAGGAVGRGGVGGATSHLVGHLAECKNRVGHHLKPRPEPACCAGKNTVRTLPAN